MDHPWPAIAAGLPFVFTGVRLDGAASREGVPRNEQAMVAEPDSLRSARRGDAGLAQPRSRRSTTVVER
jgi:hypothetical protein